MKITFEGTEEEIENLRALVNSETNPNLDHDEIVELPKEVTE